MQINMRNIINVPVYNIVPGGQIGTIQSAIVDPVTMKVLFFCIATAKQHKPLYLLTKDVRSISHDHVVIDSESSLAAADDLVRYTDILKTPIVLFNYRVITVSQKKLGNCYDYVFEANTMEVLKIYVKASMMQRLFISHHIIDITDITEIKPGVIIVRDAIVGAVRKARNVLPVETT